MMVEAMKKKGLLVEYHEFAGEGHGFRQAATIKHTLEAELTFYRKVFGIHA
jgi:dipeptidyl aminopeptidase/acylaminoacyl peptidase